MENCLAKLGNCHRLRDPFRVTAWSLDLLPFRAATLKGSVMTRRNTTLSNSAPVQEQPTAC
eukprot:2482673-Amphidinium_carterae.2